MQFAENGSLLDAIHSRKFLTEDIACSYFRQLMSAIEYIHGLGVCHRDIKCENILLDKKNSIKLIDFGFSKRLKGNDSQERISLEEGAIGHIQYPPKIEDTNGLSQTYCGSFAYASPEILKGIPYDPLKSDVWALGVVLYAMVYGRLPFEDKDVKKLVQQVQNSIKFREMPRVSEECKNLIKGMLSPLKFRSSIAKIKGDCWFKKCGYE